MFICPCGSKKPYIQCCEPYHLGGKLSDTPEALMRARYSAYCQSNITYIQNTMRGKAAVDFNAKKIKGWSLSVEWLGLKIIKSFFSDDPSVAYVEFVARYRERNKIKIIHERSEFRCIGFWYYTDGVHLPTTEMEK